MGINKILWHSGLQIGEKSYDVLIPLPATRDQCLADIGINEFDDDWGSVGLF